MQSSGGQKRLNSNLLSSPNFLKRCFTQTSTLQGSRSPRGPQEVWSAVPTPPLIQACPQPGRPVLLAGGG